MTLTEVSQFVRDLMRQPEFDRAAWVKIVAASQHQAQRLEAMEHEMLQVNDELSGVLEGYARILRANEAALQDHLKAAFGDTVLAVNAVEQGLLKGIALVKAEFLAVQQGEAALLQELRVKFGQLEMAGRAVGATRARAAWIYAYPSASYVLLHVHTRSARRSSTKLCACP